ncbi:hypothetical protein LINGRAHAP2_LOCUS20475 [Linum grandiflorum]
MEDENRVSQTSSGGSSASMRFQPPKANILGRYMCGHQRDALRKVAGTPRNAGRIFYRCPYWQNKSVDCGFFRWANERDGIIDEITDDPNIELVLDELRHISRKLRLMEDRFNLVFLSVGMLVFGSVLAIIFSRFL